MNFLRRIFTSPEVNDLISSMNGIKNSEDSVVFAGRQLYSLQFLEFINDSNNRFHDSLSSIFDIGKKMITTFENSIPERIKIPSKLNPLKEQQSIFNKFRKQKSSFEAKTASCKQNLKEKKEYLDRLTKENATQEEIKKATTQVKRAESDERSALYVMVEFNKTFDQEEEKYTKIVDDLLINPLIEWAESEAKQIDNFSKEANDYLKVAKEIKNDDDPDLELQHLLQKLNEELGE